MILRIKRDRGDDNKYQCSKRKHREMRLHMLSLKNHYIYYFYISVILIQFLFFFIILYILLITT